MTYGRVRAMPKYKYVCPKCGMVTYLFYGMDQEKPKTVMFVHKGCKNETVKRSFDPPMLNNVNRFGTRSKRDTGRDR